MAAVIVQSKQRSRTVEVISSPNRVIFFAFLATAGILLPTKGRVFDHDWRWIDSMKTKGTITMQVWWYSSSEDRSLHVQLIWSTQRFNDKTVTRRYRQHALPNVKWRHKLARTCNGSTNTAIKYMVNYQISNRRFCSTGRARVRGFFIIVTVVMVQRKKYT